jgi:Fibronectin type III domain
MTRGRTSLHCLFLLLTFASIVSAQVYITTGQTGANGKLPANWTMTAGASTPNSFQFSGGYFLMGVTTGFDYTLNVRATNSSGALLGTLNLTAAQLCAQPAGCATAFTQHTFTLNTPLTFTSPNVYYIELVGENSSTHAADTSDGLKNSSSYFWVDSSGNTVNLATTTAPGAPTGVTAAAGNAQATISYTAPSSNGGSAITGYIATATPTPSGSAVTTTCSSISTSCTVTGLSNGTSYNMSVQAQNIVGPGTSTSASNNPVRSGVSASDPHGHRWNFPLCVLDQCRRFAQRTELLGVRSSRVFPPQPEALRLQSRSPTLQGTPKARPDRS